jgi:hypothetical protein
MTSRVTVGKWDKSTNKCSHNSWLFEKRRPFLIEDRDKYRWSHNNATSRQATISNIVCVCVCSSRSISKPIEFSCIDETIPCLRSCFDAPYARRCARECIYIYIYIYAFDVFSSLKLARQSSFYVLVMLNEFTHASIVDGTDRHVRAKHIENFHRQIQARGRHVKTNANIGTANHYGVVLGFEPSTYIYIYIYQPSRHHIMKNSLHIFSRAVRVGMHIYIYIYIYVNIDLGKCTRI